ncbi:hypothetical protein K1719_021551 [Acacia pycnantha]|nr:hypothetical protein K1719_021551 [Acacia pycnantha]
MRYLWVCWLWKIQWRTCQSTLERDTALLLPRSGNTGVWDYVKDNYVHRLILSKTDGKLVELNSHCEHTGNRCGSCSCEDNAMSEAILNRIVEAIVKEYIELLATQLENQKLGKVKEETEREISKAVENAVAVKLQKLQSKLDRCHKEKKLLDDES